MRIIKLTILICLLFGTVASATGSLLSISNILQKNQNSFSDDTARLNSLIRNGFRYLSELEPSKTKEYIDTALTICEEKNIDIPPHLNHLQAEYFFITRDYSKSEDEALTTVEKAKNLGDEILQIKAMLFLGKYHLRTGFIQESINYFNNAINLSVKVGKRQMIPKAYEGLASVYNSIGDLNSYRLNLQLMIDAGISVKDTTSIMNGYYRLGTSLTDKMRNFILADSLLRTSLEIAFIKNDTFFITSSLANMGWNFYAEKMYDSSLYHYNKSLEYKTTANAYGNIGTIYRDLGNTELSFSFYQKGIEEAYKENDFYSLSWIYEDMSKMYLMKEDTGNAFKSYVLFKQFSDSLLVFQNRQGLYDAKIRYDADTRNKEFQLLSLRLKNNQLLNYGLAGFILLALSIGLLLLRSSKHKAKRQISEMNRRISDITQANLRQQMNPHFIFNTLNSIQYYMYQHDKLATNNYMTKFSSLMRKVLENSQHTSVSLRDELDALKLYLDLEGLRFKDKFDYEIIIDEEIDTLLFKVPAMLIQPYVENSICHGLMPRESNGVIRIELKLEKDYIICSIEDNGIGRAAAMDRKTMMGSNHNSLGTHITTSRLELVNALYGSSLKTIYTDLKNEEEEAMGTRVEIHIPIMT